MFGPGSTGPKSSLTTVYGCRVVGPFLDHCFNIQSNRRRLSTTGPAGVGTTCGSGGGRGGVGGGKSSPRGLQMSQVFCPTWQKMLLCSWVKARSAWSGRNRARPQRRAAPPNLSVPCCEHVGQLVNYPALLLYWDLLELKWTSVSTVTVTSACATMAAFTDPHSCNNSLNTPLERSPRPTSNPLSDLHSFHRLPRAGTLLPSRPEKGREMSRFKGKRGSASRLPFPHPQIIGRGGCEVETMATP